MIWNTFFMTQKKSKTSVKKNTEKGLFKNHKYLKLLLLLILILIDAYLFINYHHKNENKLSRPQTVYDSQTIPYTNQSIPGTTFTWSGYEWTFSTSHSETFSPSNLGVSFSLPKVITGSITNYYNTDRKSVVNGSKLCDQYENFDQDNYLTQNYEVEIEIRTPIYKLANAMEAYTQCIKPIDHPHYNGTPQSIQINGQNVVVVKDPQNYIYDQYIFVVNGIMYIFDFSNNVQVPDGNVQVQQILNSVKFSQPNIVLPE